MEYAVLVYVAPESLRGLSPEDKRSLHGEHKPPPGSVSLIAHYRFRPLRTATTIRVSGDEVVKTEGPSGDTSGRLRALYVLESGEQDAALEFAGQHPAVRLGGTAEVWPLIEAGQHEHERPGHRGWRRRHSQHALFSVVDAARGASGLSSTPTSVRPTSRSPDGAGT